MTHTILDYELEEWIRTGCLPAVSGASHALTWQHRVLYAVGHAVNDFFSLEPYIRQHTPIQALLNRRWPKNKDDFGSPLRYWEIYNRIVAELTRFSASRISESPILIYEQLDTSVPELGADLSMIFQAVWLQPQAAGGVKLQKFLAEDNAELTRAFLHMANVFWHSAYGHPPDEVEIFVLLTGRTHTYTKDMLNRQRSLDYVRLLNETVEQQKGALKERLPLEGKKTAVPAGEVWRTGTGCS